MYSIHSAYPLSCLYLSAHLYPLPRQSTSISCQKTSEKAQIKMRFSLPIATSLALFLLPLQTLSCAVQVSIPEAPVTPYGPITVPTLSSTGGAVVNSVSTTRVYYQDSDGTLHELAGSGLPGPNNPYRDHILLGPGRVRLGSPIVAIDLTTGFQIVMKAPFVFCFRSRLYLSYSSHCSSLPSSPLLNPALFLFTHPSRT